MQALAVYQQHKKQLIILQIEQCDSFQSINVLGSFLLVFQLFEGMKAYRTDDNRVVMFRPIENMKRMHRSAKRACLPVSSIIL